MHPKARPSLFRLVPAVMLLAALAAVAWPSPSRSADFLESMEQRRREVAALMESSTVCVLAMSGEDSMASGSGFIVGEGLILTNAHVVDEADDDGIYVLNESLPVTRAKKVRSAYDESGNADTLPRQDFALLRFTPPPGRALPALAFSLDARRMDRVSAWGYPGLITERDERMQNIIASGISKKNMPPPPVVYTEGTISALVKSRGEAVIHTAVISPGNSGGPLINIHGEVVGINTWTYQEEDRAAFINAALPAHLMVKFLRDNGVSPRLSERQRPKAGEPLVASGPEKTPDTPAPEEKRGNPPGAEPIPPKKEGMAYRERPDEDLKESAPGKHPSGPEKGRAGPGGDPDEKASAAKGKLPITGDPSSAGRGKFPFAADPSPAPEKKEPAATGERGRLLKRAEAGDVEAMRVLGAKHLSGDEGFGEDHGEAFRWLKKAADAGDAYGQALLGFLYLGIYDPDLRDPDKALDLLRKSASAPDADEEIQAILAELLYSGQYLGIAFNAEESLTWARAAAKKKEPTALAVLARHHYDGFVLERDWDKAGNLAEKALGQNPNEAMALGLLAAIAYFDPKSADTDKALDLAVRSARGGSALGMGIQAFVLAFSPEHRNDVEAEKLARQAAGLADEHGFYVLGWLYLEGRVVEKNPPLAWAYLNLAAERLGEVETDKGDQLLHRANKLLSDRERKKARKLRADILSDWGLTTYSK